MVEAQLNKPFKLLVQFLLQKKAFSPFVNFRLSEILESTVTEILEYTPTHKQTHTFVHALTLTCTNTAFFCVQTKSEFSQTGSDVSSCLQGDGGSC